MASDSIEFIGLGHVAKDKPTGELYVEITPTEVLPSTDGVLGEKNEVTSQSYDSSGKASITRIDKTTAITARWINDNTSNIITAPQVVAGETVRIYKLAGGNEFGWKTHGNDMDIRKRDRYCVFVSSKPSSDRENWLTKGYYFLLDAIDKKIHLHTSKADNEPIAYDLIFDTKEGKFALMDDNSNIIELDSVKGNLQIIMKERIDLITKHFTVNNGSHELISLCMELCDIAMKEQHIDSMRGNTTITPASKNAYAALKSKFQTFL